MRGGMLWGLPFRRAERAQSLLLGYHRKVNSSTFKGNLSFFSVPNMGYGFRRNKNIPAPAPIG
jgi:hypothetical protein